MSDMSADDIPAGISGITKRLLAGKPCEKADLLSCAEWWCRNISEDNVVTELAVMQVYFSSNIPTPHEREGLEDERDEAIYHLRDDFPSLIPDHV